jgi:hypothetical protein
MRWFHAPASAVLASTETVRRSLRAHGIAHVRHWGRGVDLDCFRPDVPPSPLFGATFFTITGLHMFHVATGAIYLTVVALRVNKLKHEDVEISGLYWHFVDLVWMFVFPLIYIMSVDVGHHAGL